MTFLVYKLKIRAKTEIKIDTATTSRGLFVLSQM